LSGGHYKDVIGKAIFKGKREENISMASYILLKMP